MLESVDPRGFECFPGSETADFLFFPALGVKTWQAIFTAERIGFQFLGQAVAPTSRDFVDGRFPAAFAIAVEGVVHAVVSGDSVVDDDYLCSANDGVEESDGGSVVPYSGLAITTSH